MTVENVLFRAESGHLGLNWDEFRFDPESGT